MLLEYIIANSVEIMSLICFVISFIISIVIRIKSTKKNKIASIVSNIENYSIVLEQLSQISPTHDDSIKMCLSILYQQIENLYPHSKSQISVKVLIQDTANSIAESKVITKFSYPSSLHACIDLPQLTVNKNTDLISIYENKNDYFWVSNLKEYSKLHYYISENDHFFDKCNTLIVFPISNTNTESNDNHLVGILTIHSPEKFNNVKKNKQILHCIRIVSKKLYNLMNN